jgi:tetratricopeptide (TPR) repeat protein
MSMLIISLSLVPVIYLSTFIHELGHSIFGWLSGEVVTSFGMGTGRPVLVLSWRGTKVYFGNTSALQGITFSVLPTSRPARWRRAVPLAGGIVANALTAAAAYGLFVYLPWGWEVWLTVLVINSFAAVGNAIPFRVRVGKVVHLMSSDGALILNMLRHGPRPHPAHVQMQLLAGLGDLWRQVGDTVALYLNLHVVAAHWADLGDPAEAERLLAEAAALPVPSVPLFRAEGTMLRGYVAAKAGRSAEATAALDEAEAALVALGERDDLFLIDLARAEVLSRLGKPAEAAAHLDALAANPERVVKPTQRVVLLANRLVAHADLGDHATAAALRAEYEAQRSESTPLLLDLIVYQRLARLYATMDQPGPAADASNLALTALEQLYKTFTLIDDRARLLQCQAAVIAEAKEALRRAGRTEVADGVDARFAPPEAALREREAADLAKVRRRRRLGWWLTGLHLVGGGIGLAWWFLTAEPPNVPELRAVFLLALLLFVTNGLGLLYGLAHNAAAWFVPRWRYKEGATLILYAIIGWVLGLFVAGYDLYRDRPDLFLSPPGAVSTDDYEDPNDPFGEDRPKPATPPSPPGPPPL